MPTYFYFTGSRGGMAQRYVVWDEQDAGQGGLTREFWAVSLEKFL
jgi:hypothetical protein